MRYQNNVNDQAAIIAALNAWFQRATPVPVQPVNGARLELRPNGTVLYNCGGVNNGGGFGADYVDHGLYLWVTNNLPNGWGLAGGPTAHGSGNQAGGQRQFHQDYYTFTCPLNGQRQIQGHGPDIPNGNYRVVVNFHLYVGDRYNNPLYAPAPAPVPGGGGGGNVPFDLNDPVQFPPLGS